MKTRKQPVTAGRPGREVIVRALREVYQGPAWHGPSLREVLRHVPARQAAWRPAPGRNTIRELVHHLVLGRNIMVRRVTGERVPFPYPKRAPWWARTAAKFAQPEWRADVALLEESQRRLLAAVARAPAARLRSVRSGGRTIAHELLHMAVHDGYHAGQISLLARLAPRR